MSKRWQLALGIPFFALMFFYLAMRVYTSLVVPDLFSRRGWTAEWREGKAVVVAVGEQSPATSVVQVGDEIVALQSARSDAMPIITEGFWRVPPGTRYTLTTRRDGQTQALALHTTFMQTSDPQGIFGKIFLFIFLLFTATGLAIFLLKPGDRQAWLLALMLGSIVALYPHSYNNATLAGWALTLMMVANIVALVFMPAFLHFFLIFPEPSPLLRRWPGLVRWLYLLFGLLILPAFAVMTIARYVAPGAGVTKLFSGGAVDQFVTAAAAVYMVSGLISMLLNYRAASSGARRKLRVVMAGSGAGFLNLLLMPVGIVTQLASAFPRVWSGLGKALLVTLPLIPISFAYAIIRHRVIPVSLIIRRGVRYVLVARGSILLEAIAVTLTVTAVLTYIFSRFRPSGLVIGLVSAGAGILAWKFSSRLHDKYLAPIIDRRFFRQSYDAQQIIHDLAESLRTTQNLPQLVEQVATKLQAALQTESVTMLLRAEATGDYLSYYSCEYRSSDGRAVQCAAQFRLPREAVVLTRLSETRQPLELDSALEASLSVAEQAALEQMKAALLLPLIGKDSAETHHLASLLGIIALGARLGDVPFSGEDKDLLLSVAGPTTLAIENAQLVERMIAESRRRQELEAENEQRAKELEEARQLQLSMLPKTVPQLPQLEIAAYMKTATEVGGDYYDFHQADNGELTVVVGDATGHGLKAGTMVAATKSLLNHLAPRANTVEILSQASRALKQMNFRGLFMAMTLAKVNGHRLTLSIAGMPPALLYRAGAGHVEELALRGVPLGGMTSYQYRAAELHLAPNDILVLMSDGFPERFNERGEMLGYARAGELLRECPTCSPQQIINHFLSVGEAWAEGRPQDDDVTFVVLKVR